METKEEKHLGKGCKEGARKRRHKHKNIKGRKKIERKVRKVIMN